ncbi:MAG: glycerate dehydrogenase [Neptuniibacter caesariensis]|uniref:Glycerate dehydrogenase n=1 Tax=Neptuniibacter caesariensis TaxID=207954 RepID=A0A2G6JNR6_NEPCE|nr:MAG: glycerate dehydrogenase [Neptuniibacter caesariensis]
MRAVVLDLKGLELLPLTAIEEQVEELVVYTLTPADRIAERIQGFDIVITNKTPLDRESLLKAGAGRLKYICVLATGTNVVDKDAANELNIPVSNCVAYGVDSVVQHTWSLILALSTRLVDYVNDVRGGKWQKSEQFCFLDHPITELKGKSLGIVGFGHLGQGVAKIAAAFGMTVLVSQRLGRAAQEGRVPFEEVIEQADILSLHCPLTTETENLITRETFKAMKNSALLINVARGGIVNETDLAEALKTGEIAGAAIDVLTQEPPENGNVLLDTSIPNLLITPHIAWGSEQARAEIIAQTAENIAAFLSGKVIRRV